MGSKKIKNIFDPFDPILKVIMYDILVRCRLRLTNRLVSVSVVTTP